METITVILNCYKRTRWFKEQLESIKKQTHPVSEIFVWKNQADIVGHSWFFHRDMLPVMWREMPTVDQIPIVGEDIHFAHMIQKYTDCGVYVPPHPINDKSLWGSTKGEPYGTSREGISMNRYMVNGIPMSAGQMMGYYLSKAVDDGFQLIEGKA